MSVPMHFWKCTRKLTETESSCFGKYPRHKAAGCLLLEVVFNSVQAGVGEVALNRNHSEQAFPVCHGKKTEVARQKCHPSPFGIDGILGQQPGSQTAEYCASTLVWLLQCICEDASSEKRDSRTGAINQLKSHFHTRLIPVLRQSDYQRLKVRLKNQRHAQRTSDACQPKCRPARLRYGSFRRPLPP